MEKKTLELVRELLAEAVNARKNLVNSTIDTCNPENIDSNALFKRRLIDYRDARSAFDDFCDEYGEEEEDT